MLAPYFKDGRTGRALCSFAEQSGSYPVVRRNSVDREFIHVTHYVVGLTASNCQTGDSIGSEQEEADRRENVLRTLSISATKIRQKLGESLASVQKYDAIGAGYDSFAGGFEGLQFGDEELARQWGESRRLECNRRGQRRAI